MPHLFGYRSCAIVALVVVCSCSPKPETGDRSHTVHLLEDKVKSLDSLSAVRLAARALSSGTIPLRVDSFHYVGGIYRISLIPFVQHAGYVAVGGGGLVEVHQAGQTVVLERYR